MKWRCSCLWNEKQSSTSFFNYDAKLTSVITMGTLVYFFSLAMFFCDVMSCDVINVKNFMKFWGTSFEFWLRPCHLSRPRNWRIIQLYDWELFIVCPQCVKFGGQRLRSWGDLMVSAPTKVISEDNVIEESCDFKGALSGLRKVVVTENLLKMMKNAFYFASKALFVLKIFHALSWLVGHADYKERVNFKIYDFTTWLRSNCNTHIDQYLKK